MELIYWLIPLTAGLLIGFGILAAAMSFHTPRKYSTWKVKR